MADTILEMRDITKTFPGVKALENVNLVVKRGEIHAVVGENGAGKSTLMKVLSGVYPLRQLRRRHPLRGQGMPLHRHPRQRARRHRHHPPGAGAGAACCRSPRTSSSATSRRASASSTGTRRAARSAELLRKVGLREDPDTLITNIGVGKQQLVEIAKALSKEVKLLILDEPTASLSREGQRRAARPAARVQGAGHRPRS